MSAGKAIVQGAHVSVLASVAVKKKVHVVYDAWTLEGHAKIALRVDSLEELISLKERAEKEGIVAVTIEDFGLTELKPGTMTALAIGPDRVELIDELIKDLKLF